MATSDKRQPPTHAASPAYDTIVSALAEIAAAFKLASDKFDPIKSTPNNNDLQRFNEVLVVFCLSINLTGKDAGCASGVVLPDGVYKYHHGGISFDFMPNARANYEPTIDTLATPDSRASKLHILQHMWATGAANQNRIRAVELGARNLILASVKSTWVQELRNTFTLFASVSPCEVLNHLSDHTGGLDRTSGVEIILGLNRLWESDMRVNEFIINTEEAQKKSVRAILTITNNMLAAFATYMLMKAGSFPRDCLTWYGNPAEDQIWP